MKRGLILTIVLATVLVLAPSGSAAAEAAHDWVAAVNTGNAGAVCDDLYLNTAPTSACVAYYTARPFAPISRLVYLHTTSEGASQAYVFFDVTSDGTTAEVRFAMIRPRAKWLLAGYDQINQTKRCIEPICA